KIRGDAFDCLAMASGWAAATGTKAKVVELRFAGERERGLINEPWILADEIRAAKPRARSAAEVVKDVVVSDNFYGWIAEIEEAWDFSIIRTVFAIEKAKND